MTTASIWLAWSALGWLANMVTIKPMTGRRRLVMTVLVGSSITASAILATIAVNA